MTSTSGRNVVAVDYMINNQEVLAHIETTSCPTSTTKQRLGETSAQILTFELSPLPDDTTEVEYHLVFRGRLGEEDDTVAVGIVEPISGFLVRPSYQPNDGISGSRLIVKNGRKWRLTEDQGLQAGNIDWRGWYVRGRPTKVLSWQGPPSRYFPANRQAPFTPNIYQGGELFAVAPCPVLGAAITKEVNAKEWLVAVCRAGLSDIVYRRPNTPSGSPALYDPVTNPEGWQEIGNFPPQKDALAPDRPWFFNASGTKGQTMRLLSTKHTVRLTIFRIDTPAFGLFGLVLTRGTSTQAFLALRDGSAQQASYDLTGEGAQTAQLIYVHTDHLSTPRLATDDTQAVLWRWQGLAFGNTAAREDPDGDGVKTTFNLRFPGQYHDTESGLYYNWNRYYDPGTGRYVTSDPIGLAGGLSTYVYVLNNPLRYVDPFGLYGTTSCDYYNRRCDETGSTYYCDIAQFVCRRTPPGDWPNCVRLCLQQFDVQYCRDPCKPGDIDPLCIVNAHQVCWQECLRDSGPRIPSHPY